MDLDQFCVFSDSFVDLDQFCESGPFVVGLDRCGSGPVLWVWIESVELGQLCGSGPVLWIWTNSVDLDQFRGSGPVSWIWTRFADLILRGIDPLRNRSAVAVTLCGLDSSVESILCGIYLLWN